MAGFSVREDLKATYSDFYDGQSEWRRVSALGKADNIVTLCADLPHRTILDVGAGEGSVLNRLGELGFGETLHAAEISESAKDALSGRSIPGFAGVELFDGYNLPFPDQSLDIVILSHVVEHLEYPRKLITDAARIGRHVFIEVPLEHTRRLGENFAPNPMGHINFYAKNTIRQLVQTCDLQIESAHMSQPDRSAYVHQFGRFKGGLKHSVKGMALRMMPGFSQALWSYHYSLVARRQSD